MTAAIAACAGTADAAAAPEELVRHLPYRGPICLDDLLDFLGRRAVPGVESLHAGTYRRSLALPHGAGVVALSGAGDRAAGAGYVRCRLRLEDPRDAEEAVRRCRRLLDLDADPAAIAEVLAHDPDLAPLVRRAPGRRVPGHVDGAELAVRAILGQQVTVAAARTLATRLVARYGRPLGRLAAPTQGVTHLFPDPAALAEAGLEDLPVPGARKGALRAVARAIAGGGLTLGPGVDRLETERRLLALPGIGPWTASYVAMRALGNTDAFLPTDVGVRRAAAGLGWAADPASLVARGERWRPWRAYATLHLWASLQRPKRAEHARSPSDRRP